jgi:CRISPR/Cas system-associated endonuclease Cas3-HD
LNEVSRRAAEFADKLGLSSYAEIAELLHDLGKYADQMQRRLRGEPEPGRNHWSMGAYVALRKYEPQGGAIAAAIDCHHVGLPMLLPFSQ